MAQKNREKDVWLIPKRGSLHQTICLIKSIIEKNYNNTSWNQSKQNTLGTELKKLGAVRTRTTPSNQSIRTLVASLPQYLGFLYIDTATKPNIIRITPMGFELYNSHNHLIKPIGTLGEGLKNNELILESKDVRTQFEKLEITNPVILKDCEEINVFPFRIILELLRKLNYLDQEELAFFVFRTKSHDQIGVLIKQIQQFRKMNLIDRKELIDEFKKTHIGNITLVQAPSANYFISLMLNTGVFKKVRIRKENINATVKDTITAIMFKDANSLDYANHVLDIVYKDVEYYDFEDNLKLWVYYIGTKDVLYPPKNVKVNKGGEGQSIILVKHNGEYLAGDLLSHNEYITVPMFKDHTYEIIAIDKDSGQVIHNEEYVYDYKDEFYSVSLNSKATFFTLEETVQLILEHSASKTFDKNYLSYLKVVESIEGKSYIDQKWLRGAYYELLFFNFLTLLCEKGIIDDVYWNGHIGSFGLPRAAPGGKTGTPDIVFKINNNIFVLELTTIKNKSGQENAETFSVPDHVKLVKKENPSNPVIGIFVAPLLHERVINGMNGALIDSDVKLLHFMDSDFLKLMMSLDRNKIVDELLK